MSKKWFKLHTDVRHNFKTVSLDGETFKTWIFLLCLAAESDNNGIIDESIKQIAYEFHMTPQELSAHLTILATAQKVSPKAEIKQALITVENGFILVNNWAKRQYAEGYDRVLKYRETKELGEIEKETEKKRKRNKKETEKKQKRNVPEAEAETETETEYRTITEAEQNPPFNSPQGEKLSTKEKQSCNPEIIRLKNFYCDQFKEHDSSHRFPLNANIAILTKWLKANRDAWGVFEQKARVWFTGKIFPNKPDVPEKNFSVKTFLSVFDSIPLENLLLKEEIGEAERQRSIEECEKHYNKLKALQRT